MEKNVITLSDFSTPSAPKQTCNCGGNCQCASAPKQPLKTTAEEVLNVAKQTVSKVKTEAKNDSFQKGALAVSALVLLYVILK